jgi:hypothetical protein
MKEDRGPMNDDTVTFEVTLPKGLYDWVCDQWPQPGFPLNPTIEAAFRVGVAARAARPRPIEVGDTVAYAIGGAVADDKGRVLHVSDGRAWVRWFLPLPLDELVPLDQLTRAEADR